MSYLGIFPVIRVFGSAHVPQGSNLSSINFCIDMKLLAMVSWQFGAGCHQYANDSHLSLSPNTKWVVEVLEMLSGGIWDLDEG